MHTSTTTLPVSTAAFSVLLFTFLWKNSGYHMVLWLSGMDGIPKELYEAARLDGAGPWQQLLHITLPNLLPTVGMLTVIALINTFKVFREAWLVAGNYPHDSMYLLRHLLEALTAIAQSGAVTAPEGGILEEITEKTFSISNPYGGNLLTFSLEPEDAALLTARTRVTISREEQTADLLGCTRKPGEDLTFTVPVVKTGWEPGNVQVRGILWEDLCDSCIPLEALRRDRNGYFVFVLEQQENLWAIEQTARKVYVQIVKRDDSHASVSGLESDMEVIVTTSKPLTDGSRVRVMP